MTMQRYVATHELAHDLLSPIIAPNRHDAATVFVDRLYSIVERLEFQDLGIGDFNEELVTSALQPRLPLPPTPI